MTGLRARIRKITLERQREEAAVREAIEHLISRVRRQAVESRSKLGAIGIAMASLAARNSLPRALGIAIRAVAQRKER
jgi:hypothetical protein